MQQEVFQERIEPDLIRSARFRKEREADWKRLDELLVLVEKKGLGKLDYEAASELSTLYRQAVNSLSLAREISLDRALLNYLENLAARGYLAVYAPQRSFGDAVVRTFTHGIPQAVRRSWLHFLVAALFMTLGGLVAYVLTRDDPGWFYAFVDRGFSAGRGPEASEGTLRDVLYGNNSDMRDLSAFSVRLFTHNTQVSFFSYALGVMAGLPTAFLMFYNGSIIGAFFAVHESKGLALDLFGWLSIHGVTELTAILMAATGGLRMATAVVFPGARSRAQALRDCGRDAVRLAILAALMLLVAGFLEGFGRQLIDDLQIRLLVGWGIGALWLSWFVFSGRETGRPSR